MSIDPNKRFNAKFRKTVCKVDELGDCWQWTGAIYRNGYAAFNWNKRTNCAHIFAVTEIAGLIIPEGMECDHLCRNRSCVNPSHIEIVTAAENMRRGTALEKRLERDRSITHCPQGHEYAGSNIIITSTGSRSCRICAKVHGLAFYYRNREARNEACKVRNQATRDRLKEAAL